MCRKPLRPIRFSEALKPSISFFIIFLKFRRYKQISFRCEGISPTSTVIFKFVKCKVKLIAF